MERFFLMLCAANGFLAVALGAFGAHGLRGRLGAAADAARRIEVWETAARYQLAHAFALALAAYLVGRGAGSLAQAAGYLFVCGIVLFSGSLYGLGLTGVRALGAVTPLGGLCFLAGWVCVAFAAHRLA